MRPSPRSNGNVHKSNTIWKRKQRMVRRWNDFRYIGESSPGKMDALMSKRTRPFHQRKHILSTLYKELFLWTAIKRNWHTNNITHIKKKQSQRTSPRIRFIGIATAPVYLNSLPRKPGKYTMVFAAMQWWNAKAVVEFEFAELWAVYRIEQPRW